MKLLVIGSGGREHAIAKKLLRRSDRAKQSTARKGIRAWSAMAFR